jgi:transposase
MFYDPRSIAVFLYSEPVDCRKAHNGLVFIVTSELCQELRSGSLFVFVSRDGKTLKALKWDGSGVIIFHKKLERGRIMRLGHCSKPLLNMSAEEFVAFASGAQVRLDLKL